MGKILGDAAVASFPASLRSGPQITFRNSCAFGWAVAGGRAKVKKGWSMLESLVGVEGDDFFITPQNFPENELVDVGKKDLEKKRGPMPYCHNIPWEWYIYLHEWH